MNMALHSKAVIGLYHIVNNGTRCKLKELKNTVRILRFIFFWGFTVYSNILSTSITTSRTYNINGLQFKVTKGATRDSIFVVIT